jgi:hypothetical protein
VGCGVSAAGVAPGRRPCGELSGAAETACLNALRHSGAEPCPSRSYHSVVALLVGPRPVFLACCSDIEGSDTDTRRRVSTDLVRALCKQFEEEVREDSSMRDIGACVGGRGHMACSRSAVAAEMPRRICPCNRCPVLSLVYNTLSRPVTCPLSSLASPFFLWHRPPRWFSAM